MDGPAPEHIRDFRTVAAILVIDIVLQAGTWLKFEERATANGIGIIRWQRVVAEVRQAR